MVWHERFKCLSVVIYRLTTVSHVRVGSGENIKLPTPVDNPQTRILRLVPAKQEEKWLVYIPGSSLHGVIRSALEDYLRTVAYNDSTKNVGQLLNSLDNKKLKDWMQKEVNKYRSAVPGIDELLLFPEVCYPTLTFDACQWPPDQQHVEYYKKVGRVSKENEEPIPCLVCQLFGAPGLRGRVRILNAYPSKETAERLPLEVITRVAINRVTGAAEERRLFDLEAIPPGATFYFAVVIDNGCISPKIPKDSTILQKLGLNELNFEKLFETGLKMVSSGLVPIGAHGGVGFGLVEIKEVGRLNIQEGRMSEFLEGLVNKNLQGFLEKHQDALILPKDKECPSIDEELYPLIVRELAKAIKSDKEVASMCNQKEQQTAQSQASGQVGGGGNVA